MITASTFYVVVKSNLQIEIFYHEMPPKDVKGLYFIKSFYCGYSSSRKHIFYGYEVRNSQKKVITDNVMTFNFISCKLPDKDIWTNPVGSHNFVVFEVEVVDKNKKTKFLLFDNKEHHANLFIVLFQYISDLQENFTHEKVTLSHLFTRVKVDYLKYNNGEYKLI